MAAHGRALLDLARSSKSVVRRRYGVEVINQMGVTMLAAAAGATPALSPWGTLASSPAPRSSGTPIWLSILLAVLTLVGVLGSAFFLRKTGRESRTSAEELDRRGKREETMRTLRWAAERAVSKEDRESRLGIAALDSLGGSAWLEPDDQNLIDAVVASVTLPAAEAYREEGRQLTAFELSPGDDA